MAFVVLDREFGHSESPLGGKYGDKTVHIAIQGNILKNFAAVLFETAVEIMQGDAAPLRHDAVENLGRPGLVDGVMPDFPPADDEIKALVQLCNHSRNFRRIILQVRIKVDEYRPPALLKPRRHGGAFAEIPAETDDGNPRIFFREPCKVRKARIPRAVVYEQYLGVSEPLQTLR